MKVPVNVSVDVVLGVTSHMAPAPPLVNVAAEGTLQGAPPGLLLGTHKMSSTVTHKGWSIVQQGHDVGPLVPHLTAPIAANPWYGKILPAASIKVVFGAQSVQVQGAAAGVATLIHAPPLPLLTCGEPLPLPTAFPVTAFKNTVHVEVTLRDLLAGALDIILSVAIEWIVGKLIPGPDPEEAKSFEENLIDGLSDLLLRPLGAVPEEAKKGARFGRANGVVTALAKMALSSLAGVLVTAVEGHPKLSVSLGTAAGKATVEYDMGKVKPGADGKVHRAKTSVSVLGATIDDQGKGSGWIK